jgi:beta-carotene 3-hydroxylase
MGIVITLVTFIIMEGVTWLTHKYVMHGFLWKLHSDHHKKDHQSFFERNDLFFVIFAIPSILLFATGAFAPQYHFLTYIGLGIFMYGMAYFLVHDVFIHQRFRWLRKTDNIYFRGLRKAHKIHHKHLGKEKGECFGMLWVPFRYFREARKQ